jgi:putative ABC transport system permease protein
MHGIWQDIRYGLRGLRKQPSFTLLAMLALALGIGAATTIFSAIHGVLLDPFPYTDAERVVQIMIHDLSSSRPGGRMFFPVPEFLDYQEQNHVFDGVIGGTYEDVMIPNGEGNDQFMGGAVTPNMFQFLGVPAQVGRTLTPDDAKPGAPPVFVMSYKMWLKQYNLDPKILGRSFNLNNVPTTLVGIMPSRFTKLDADLWRNVIMNRSDPDAKEKYFRLQAKLKPGVTLKQAQADISVIAHRLSSVYPDNYPKKFSVEVISWVDSLVGQFRSTLYTLAAAVGLLLLIACANVANMLLARATAREKEMAVRASLGASRGRLLRQLLIESLLLALGGAILGCLFAFLGIQGLTAAIPRDTIPHESVIRLNVPVLLFSLLIAAVTALLFGLAPAVQTARRDIVEPLKDSGKGVSGGFRHGRLRGTLVVIEVALSLILLAGAGLLMRSFVKMQQVELGFDPRNILFSRLPLPPKQYKTVAAKQHFFRQLLPRLQALPGVVAVTEITSPPPFGGINSEIDIPGKPHSEKWTSIFQLCSEGFFPTVGTKLVRGRTLSEVEVNDGRKVAVVNQTMVNKYFGNDDPIGRRITIKMLEKIPDGKVENPSFEVIGVVQDVRNSGIQDPPSPEMFIPYTVTGAFDRSILVRTNKNPMVLENAVKREIWAVDRNVATTFTGTLEDFLARFWYAGPRFALILLGVFAGVGLVLVALGVYSVIAYTVSRQTHEIGIRMALGAGSGDVLVMVLRMGLRMIAIGVAAGLLASIGLARLAASQLWGISPHDPIALGGVVAVVAMAGFAACYFPARRATRVDPLIALRYE